MAQAPEEQPLADEVVPPTTEEVPHHKRRKTKQTVAELNLTSMIDVVFQLLIYFIITVNFVIDEGVLMSNLPEVSATPPEQDPIPPMDIKLRAQEGAAECVISYNGNIIPSFTELRQQLEQGQNNPAKGRTGFFPTDHVIKIEPSRYVRWQFSLNAFNAALQADYTNVSFAPTEPRD